MKNRRPGVCSGAAVLVLKDYYMSGVTGTAP